MTSNSNTAINTSYDVFKEVEDYLKLRIPTYIKNLLTINGYTNENIIAQISERDMQDIEIFAQTILPTTISRQQYKQYYSIFENCVQNFKIVHGHRKLIQLTADYFKNKMGVEKQPSASASTGEKVSNSRLYETEKYLTTDHVLKVSLTNFHFNSLDGKQRETKSDSRNNNPIVNVQSVQDISGSFEVSAIKKEPGEAWNNILLKKNGSQTKNKIKSLKRKTSKTRRKTKRLIKTIKKRNKTVKNAPIYGGNQKLITSFFKSA